MPFVPAPLSKQFTPFTIRERERAALARQQQMSHQPLTAPPEWMRPVGDAFIESLQDPAGRMQRNLREGLDTFENQLAQKDPSAIIDFFGPSKVAGIAGIFGKADASILSGLSKGIKDQVTAMQNIVSKNPDEFNKHYVHDPATGRNLFVDNRGELIVEYPDVVGKYAIGLGDKTEYTRSVFERNIPHPDPKAKELLSDTHLSVSPHNTATYFRSGEGFIKDKIEIKSGKKDRVYPTETDEYNRIRKALGETFNKNSTPGFDYMAASSARKKLSGEEETLRQRIADINERKNTLANAFTVSYVAHEGAHKAQKATSLPGGGNPRTEARKIFTETIGKDPQKLVEYNMAVDMADKWLAQDPIQLMVAITQLKPSNTTYKKYIDMLYASPDETISNKFFNKVNTVDNNGLLTGTSFKPNKQKILDELLQDVKLGHLDVSGTNLEPWVKMNMDAFSAYKNKYGEVYARAAQKRAFEAASGKDPDVYKKNPQAYIDVNTKDITYDK